MALNYLVYYGTAAATNNGTNVLTNGWTEFGGQISATTDQVTGLVASTSYYFRVFTVDTVSGLQSAATQIGPLTTAGESVEGLTVTAPGTTIFASQTQTVADPTGPFNTFSLQTSSGSGLQINFNNGTIQSANVLSLVYHDHTLFQNAVNPATWSYWSTTTSAYVAFGVSAVTLATTVYPASAAAGTVVSAINVTEAGDTFGSGGLFGGTLTLTDPTGTFVITGLNLVVAPGKTASASSYTISITAQVPTTGGGTVGPVVTLSNQVLNQQSLSQGLVIANLGTVNSAQPVFSNHIGNTGVGPYEFLPASTTSFDSLANTGVQQNINSLGFTLMRIHVGNESTIMTDTFPTSSNGTYATATWTQFDELFAALPTFVNLTNTRLILTGGVAPSWCVVTGSTGQTQYGTMMAAIAQRAVFRNCEILYWEPYNEPDGGKVTSAQYAALHVAVAQALKSYATTNSRGYYNVGGPCIQEVPYSTWIANMVTACVAANVPVDFLSWHDYPTGSVGTSIGWPAYVTLAQGRAGTAHTGVVEATGASNSISTNIPCCMTEWNMSFDTTTNGDPWATQYYGAIWAALYIYTMMTQQSGANMQMMAWYEAAGDGNFGIVRSTTVAPASISPVGYMLSRMNSVMPGNQVTSSVNSSLTNVACLATANGSNFGVMLINYNLSTAFSNVTITLNGYGSSLAAVWQVTPAALQGTTSSVSTTNLATTGITLPAMSVTFISQSATRQAGTRFPYPTAGYTVPAWPYAYNSVWNIGIGSNALFSGPTASDPVTTNLLSAGAIAVSSPGTVNVEWDYPLYVGASTDTTFTWTGATGWPGQTATQTGSIHVPSNATPSSDSDIQLLIMDATQPTLFMSFDNSTTLNRTNNTLTGGIWSHWDTSGNGRANFGQGNLHVPLQGADMDNITNGGGIFRMLPCHIFPNQAMPWGLVNNWSTSLTSLGFYNCVWPAIASDFSGGTGSGGGAYSGLIPFGSIIFIPKSVIDMTTWSFGGINPLGLSLAGMAIAQQLQNYGWHVENTGGSFLLYTSWDVTSTTARTTRYNELATVLDGTTLLQYMRVMKSWMTGMAAGQTPATPPGAGYQYDPNYNPNAPINGGGTYPLAPPYWDSSLPSTFTSQNTY